MVKAGEGPLLEVEGEDAGLHQYLERMQCFENELSIAAKLR